MDVCTVWRDEVQIVKEELNGSGLLSTVEKYCREKSFPFTAFVGCCER